MEKNYSCALSAVNAYVHCTYMYTQYTYIYMLVHTRIYKCRYMYTQWTLHGARGN